MTIPTPWDQWIPGALNSNQVRELHSRGLVTIRGGGDPKIKPCSIDLTLSEDVYRMQWSIKPSSDKRYENELKHNEPIKIEADGTFFLNRGSTYVIRLREELAAALGGIGVHGQATAKSTIGRLDVLARLIVDFMDTYECFDAKALEKADGPAKMYLEITPITFNIKVKPGESLSQLRLFYGAPSDSRVAGDEICRTVIRSDGDKKDDVLRLNLQPVQIGDIPTCAYHARKDCKDAILTSSGEKSIDPSKYWERVSGDAQSGIQIEKEEFYILRSLERLWVPKGIAIYCEASDETMGEMRIHYAGFVHPGFGLEGPNGAPLIFEVRGHQVKAGLRHREKMAKLIFYRMSEPDYDKTPYDKQELNLSKIFADWPKSNG